MKSQTNNYPKFQPCPECGGRAHRTEKNNRVAWYECPKCKAPFSVPYPTNTPRSKVSKLERPNWLRVGSISQALHPSGKRLRYRRMLNRHQKRSAKADLT